jgi:hypothetical protein
MEEIKDPIYVLISNLKQLTMKKRILPFLMFMLLASMGFAQTHKLLVTVPDSVETIYVSGEFNNWKDPSSAPADSATLISNSPKVFSIEYSFVGLVDTLEYKFYSGPSWSYEQKDATNFIVMNDSATAVVDTFKAVYQRKWESDVTIDVLVPKEVYVLNLTGSFNNWNPTANPMEMIDSTANGKEFQVTIHVMDTVSLEYKFIAGPGWPYEQKDAANFKYTVTHGISTVDEFKKIFNPNELGDITVHILSVPEGTTDVYIIGSWGNSWKLEEAIKAVKNDDGSYTAVVTNVADIDFKVYNYPGWDYEEAVDDQGNSVADRHASTADSPVEITVAFWKALYIPTGVKDPISAAYKLYTVNSTIVVEGVTSNVSVYDINGRMMQSVRAKGTFISRSLQPGIYILRVDNLVQKIGVQ